MNSKQITGMYFSGTGTTERIVTLLTSTVAAELQIPDSLFDFTPPAARTEPKAFSETDVVILGVPVIAGRVPNLLLKYLGTVSGNGALGIPVVLYGNRNYDDALIELRNIMEKNGFHTVAGAAFIGEHSFSYTLGKGRPDAADMTIAAQFATKAADKIRSGSFVTPVPVKGEDPIRPYYTPRDRKGTPINILKVKPKTTDACTGCGICVAACPLGSINPDNPAEITGICMKCCACVKKCPVGAKYYDDPGFLYHKEELELGYARRAEPELFL